MVKIGKDTKIRVTLEEALKSEINFSDKQLIVWFLEYCKELEDRIKLLENQVDDLRSKNIVYGR